MRNNKGVTLVALVITIIVLLILAGVSLAMLTGDSGILTNADAAKKETAIANAKSSIEMAYMDIKTEVYALEAKKPTAQAVAMDASIMTKIAKKYITTSTDVTINPETASIDAANTDAKAIKIEYKDTNINLNAIIIYDPTPGNDEPRVKLDPSWD